ncbi:MAG: hypothetical protein ACSLFQ_06690 [Thermoanaerobaculia bacterium]
MDTDSLTEDAYQAIRLAREASPYFGAKLAISGAKAQTEYEFLRCMLQLVEEFAENPDETSESLGDDLSPAQVAVLCIRLRSHILHTLGKPINERGGAPF